MNADLLGLASRQFASVTRLDLIEANVNELTCSGEKWDVILCVSALHHVVELERVMKFCHDSLDDGGEFWSIGEYVGRNGNRLWPEARYEANKLFKQIPARYRWNHHANRTDEELPDNDCAVSTFEGIRSEEIESALDKWFSPVDVYRRNCFLWRLVNLAYADNFDVQKSEDRSWIIRMVNAELTYFRSGGRATELNGVYRPRFGGVALEKAGVSRFARFGRRVLGLFSRQP
jgi:SAM-dependent methyltransferase